MCNRQIPACKYGKLGMKHCYLNVGSNIEPYTNIDEALEWLRTEFSVRNVSRLYQSPSAGFAGDDFLNLAVEIETELSLSELYDRLKGYEFLRGRHLDSEKYSSRLIDIDIVTFDDYVGCYNGITLPRPELFYRPYVLKPIVDIGSTKCLPKSRATYGGILRRKLRVEPEFLDSLLDMTARVDLPVFPTMVA